MSDVVVLKKPEGIGLQGQGPGQSVALKDRGQHIICVAVAVIYCLSNAMHSIGQSVQVI